MLLAGLRPNRAVDESTGGGAVSRSVAMIMEPRCVNLPTGVDMPSQNGPP